jgi:hypothetical protein
MPDSSPSSLEEALKQLQDLSAPLAPSPLPQAHTYLAFGDHDTAADILKTYSSALEQAKADVDVLIKTLSTTEKDTLQNEDLAKQLFQIKRSLGLGARCRLPDGTLGCWNPILGCVRC